MNDRRSLQLSFMALMVLVFVASPAVADVATGRPH